MTNRHHHPAHGGNMPGGPDHERFGGRRERHGEGPRRGGRRHGPHVGRGDVRAATLLLLEEQPLHGYQIIHLVEQRSGGLWRPSAGSVYPALQLLEDEGLVQAEMEEGRRVYHLTESGRAYVAERRDELTAARDAVTEHMQGGWMELRDLQRQVDMALRQVAQVGTPAQIAAARELVTATRRRLYHILAEDETATPSAAEEGAPDERR